MLLIVIVSLSKNIHYFLNILTAENSICSRANSRMFSHHVTLEGLRTYWAELLVLVTKRVSVNIHGFTGYFPGLLSENCFCTHCCQHHNLNHVINWGRCIMFHENTNRSTDFCLSLASKSASIERWMKAIVRFMSADSCFKTTNTKQTNKNLVDLNLFHILTVT